MIEYKKVSPFTTTYILSFISYTRQKSDIDKLIFDKIQFDLNYLISHPEIDLDNLIDISYTKPTNKYNVNQYNIIDANSTTIFSIQSDNLKSGIIFNKGGISYKFVIPAMNDKIINVMKIGVEPDQIEDLKSINITPKAGFEVVIPIN